MRKRIPYKMHSVKPTGMPCYENNTSPKVEKEVLEKYLRGGWAYSFKKASLRFFNRPPLHVNVKPSRLKIILGANRFIDKVIKLKKNDK